MLHWLQAERKIKEESKTNPDKPEPIALVDDKMDESLKVDGPAPLTFSALPRAAGGLPRYYGKTYSGTDHDLRTARDIFATRNPVRSGKHHTSPPHISSAMHRLSPPVSL